MNQSRKEFLKKIGLLSAGTFVAPNFIQACSAVRKKDMFFDISLAEWSLNKALFNGDLTNMQFPETAKNEFGIDAVEYVNQFFKDKATDKSYLDELNKRCNDLGVDQVLIMIDGEGNLALNDDKERMQAVENHYKWVEAASYLGCHAIRVNVFGNGTPEEQKQAAVTSLGTLGEFAADYDISIIVENHGGYSSNADWLAGVMQQVDMSNVGTLPDFGNFCIKRKNGSQWDGECADEYDKYQGVKKMMPYAKGVSAKSYGFDEHGFETTIDFKRMLNIIKDSGFDGYIGVEYEGANLPPAEGIRATKKLLETVGAEIS